MACSYVGFQLPVCFFQLHWLNWVAPYCGSPGAPADSAWASTQAAGAFLPAGCSSVRRRANHHTGSLPGLPTLPHPSPHFLHRLHRLNRHSAGKTWKWSRELLRPAGGTQGRARWKRALPVMMTSSAAGEDYAEVRSWCIGRPEITCRGVTEGESDALIQSEETLHRSHSNNVKNVRYTTFCLYITIIFNRPLIKFIY